jgi:hypothetical protein
VKNKTKSCIQCKHHNKDKWGTCKAYPKGIPFEIVSGAVGHVEPYKGDNGIRFEEDK